MVPNTDSRHHGQTPPGVPPASPAGSRLEGTRVRQLSPCSLKAYEEERGARTRLVLVSRGVELGRPRAWRMNFCCRTGGLLDVGHGEARVGLDARVPLGQQMGVASGGVCGEVEDSAC